MSMKVAPAAQSAVQGNDPFDSNGNK